MGDLRGPMKWKPWLRACIKDPNPETQLDGLSLAMLTGQDARALEAIAACWQLWSTADDEGRAGALDAVRALLRGLQPKCHGFARELIAFAIDWPDRDRLWPLVAPRVVGVCHVCGCTNALRCDRCSRLPGRHFWIDDAETLCSTCLHHTATARNVAERARPPAAVLSLERKRKTGSTLATLTAGEREAMRIITCEHPNARKSDDLPAGYLECPECGGVVPPKGKNVS